MLIQLGEQLTVIQNAPRRLVLRKATQVTGCHCKNSVQEMGMIPGSGRYNQVEVAALVAEIKLGLVSKQCTEYLLDQRVAYPVRNLFDIVS